MIEDINQLNQDYKAGGESPQSNGDLVAKVERDEAGRFLGGHGRIGGVQKGYISVKRMMRDKLQEIKEIGIGDRKEQKTIMEILIEVLIKKAVGGDLGAIRELFDRCDGRVGQMGVGEEPDQINLVQVFQQIINEKNKIKENEKTNQINNSKE